MGGENFCNIGMVEFLAFVIFYRAHTLLLSFSRGYGLFGGRFGRAYFLFLLLSATFFVSRGGIFHVITLACEFSTFKCIALFFLKDSFSFFGGKLDSSPLGGHPSSAFFKLPESGRI